ncbi:hypothetical protein NC651_024857 [Populus alba x Populus x berolinensis]|nr:hypothetical protein NC651_024857 [Populus alba x Populus x berolinensis]
MSGETCWSLTWCSPTKGGKGRRGGGGNGFFPGY